MSSNNLNCYHCGNDILELEPIKALVKEQEYNVCCLGCKAVTEHIYNNGLGSYYDFRSDLATRPDEDVNSDQFAVYEDIGFLDLISEQINEHTRKIILSVDNIHCAACAWLIEQSLISVEGITRITVNTVNQRAELQWQPDVIPLAQILARLASIGYPSSPFKVTDTEQKIKAQEKQYIRRLGVAGLFTMQVMMLAIAMYFGAFSNMESHQTSYFKWISLVLSIPVIFYSALPFLHGAYYSLKAKKLNMDVPVALAIYGAFFASLYQLLKYGMDGNQGEVFFESISMFTFLLLIGKYLEFKAKSKAVLSNANLNKTIPATATKLDNGEAHTCLVKNLTVGDRIIIKPGEHIAVDGAIVEGKTSVNESVLNGEFEPISKSVDDNVLAGSINNDGAIQVTVTAVGEQTTLSKIGQLQAEFSSHKPQYTEFADKIAHWFVFSQLILASITYVYWYFNSPTDALWISLSVLVATCPCALSLATPTAYTCIMSTLNRRGILIKDPLAFDKLNSITHVGFDKTGTLTAGKFQIQQSQYDNTELQIDQLKAAIIKLQMHSEHPIAKAFTSQDFKLERQLQNEVEITEVEVKVGNGISALLNGAPFKIGKADFCKVLPEQTEIEGANVFVSYKENLVASFLVSDHVKPEAQSVLQRLSDEKMATFMLTGDSSNHADKIAKEMSINHYLKACFPENKAKYVAELQSKGHSVLMIGDGINDAPVFSASNISIAMGDGADVTKYAADIIILRGDLSSVTELFNAARKTRKTIKDNLYWALIYNALILPIAMAGYVVPYIAVIGMSASSILVVTHSLKLLKLKGITS